MAAESEHAEKVFRALGDRTRRKILLILNESPGATVSEVCDAFPTSRFAVMKHLNILEEAGLIRREKDSTKKRLFLEPEHLRATVVDWIEHLD